jgi:HD superfamily phosphodiesterase
LQGAIAMNAADKKPNYKRMYRFVKEKFDKTTHFKHGPFDETYYTLRVYECAKEIIRRIRKKVKTEQILVACILHDIGKIRLRPSKMFLRNDVLDTVFEEWHKHAKHSVPVARRFLKKLGHSPEFIEEVLYLIQNHDLRRKKQKTLELKILQDADLIADIGFAGFIRPFLFCGKFNKQSVIGSIKFIRKEDRTAGGKELNLAVSKSIARREMKIQRRLVQEISKEIESDLL